MSFASDIRRFVVKVKARERSTYVGAATRVHRSIRGTGTPDPVTGAPGQPVDTGFLQGSWTLAIGVNEATISTNVAYARVIEDNNRAAYDDRGVKPAPKQEGDAPRRKSIKSKVGGNHSVKLTVAHFQRLVDDVVRGLGA